MEAAKKADQAFGVTAKSGAHTVRIAENDIQKLQVLSRSETASPFTNPETEHHKLDKRDSSKVILRRHGGRKPK